LAFSQTTEAFHPFMSAGQTSAEINIVTEQMYGDCRRVRNVCSGSFSVFRTENEKTMQWLIRRPRSHTVS